MNIGVHIGKEFGSLTVVAQAGSGNRGVSWYCLCVCGKTVRLSTFRLVKDGHTSCGCIRKQRKGKAVNWLFGRKSKQQD